METKSWTLPRVAYPLRKLAQNGRVELLVSRNVTNFCKVESFFFVLLSRQKAVFESFLLVVDCSLYAPCPRLADGIVILRIADDAEHDQDRHLCSQNSSSLGRQTMMVALAGTMFCQRSRFLCSQVWQAALVPNPTSGFQAESWEIYSFHRHIFL